MRTDWFRPDFTLDTRTRRRIETEIMIGWACMLAEHRLGVSGDDLTGACQEDFAAIVDLEVYVGGSDDATSSSIEELQRRAVELLDREDMWANVEKVAAALLAEGTLSARRVRELMGE